MIDEVGARTGRSIPSGRLAWASASFSATVWRACAMSMPHSNSTHTTEIPTAVAERTRRTPPAPFKALSIGKVTWASTSVGAMP